MKKNIIFTLVLLFVFTSCASNKNIKTSNPISSRLANMPKATYAPVAGIFEDKLFVLFGSGNINTFKYSIKNNSWKILSHKTTDVNNAAYVALDNKIFIFGGWENLKNKNRDEAMYFDMTTEKFTKIKSLPYTINAGKAVVYNGKIYICGGWIDKKEGTTDSILIYNPQNNSYSKGTPMPKRIHATAAASTKKGIYIFGGTYKGNKKIAYFYNGTKWTQIADLPYKLSGATAVGIGKYVYIIGGSENYSVFNRTLSKKAILRYNTEKNIYETVGSMLKPRNALAIAKNSNNDVYSIAGPDQKFWTGILELHRFNNK